MSKTMTLMVATLMLACLFAAPLAAQEAALNEDVIKAVRAVIASQKPEDIEKYRKELFARTDLDWPSFKQGLMTGAYYRKPIVTEMGLRHGGKHLGVRLRGADGKDRGFSMYLPQGYNATDKIPVLVYLHHAASAPIEAGGEKSDVAIAKLKDICEEHNILLLVPYTGSGGEWWTDEGVKLIRWSLTKVHERYNIDEDRVGLMGALDGAEAVWLVAQRLPGTFSVLMPMSGDPYEMAALIRPIYLGTLDRMDVLCGVPGQLRTNFGDKDANAYLDGLKPLFAKRLRLTLSVQMDANSDFHYLERIKRQIAGFLLDKEHARKPLADEVDVETDGPEALRSLWLEVKGYDADVQPPRQTDFPSTRLEWSAPARSEPKKLLGIGLENRDNWPLGKVINKAELGSRAARINTGDVLVMVEGTVIKKDTDLAALIEDKGWDDEVEVVLAREVNENDRKLAERQQRQYLQVRRKVAELKAAGKPVPRDTSELIEEEAGDGAKAEEEEEDVDSAIEISDDDEGAAGDEAGAGGDGGAGGGAGKGKGAGHDRKPKSWFVFKRWIRLIRPEGVLVRADFGVTWDHQFDKEGVRVAGVIPGTLADRSGLKTGDVVVQVLGESVKTMGDLRKAFDTFKFEQEPEGERAVTFDVKRPSGEGQHSEVSVTVRWEPVKSYRVDAKWDKPEKQLDILVRHASEATIFLTDEFIKPGEEFHVFINGVPYQDLIDPAGRPDYPEFDHRMESGDQERLRRMRRKRAKIEAGWQPDLQFALEDQLDNPDRSCVVGAKLHLDFSKMKDGFEQARSKVRKPDEGKGQRLEEAVGKFGDGKPE